MQTYFSYTEQEINYLKKNDKILGNAIESIGEIKSVINPNIFESLISSIVSQQISATAAVTVYSRLKDLLKDVTPRNIYKTSLEDIQKCGMSMRKAGYIKSTATSVILGTPSLQQNIIIADEDIPTLDIDIIDTLTDEEIIKKLSALRGIGKWTAQMILIFSLNRKDVISYEDLAIRRGIKILYNIEEDLTKHMFKEYTKKYSPFSSLASLYLWEIASKSIKS